MSFRKELLCPMRNHETERTNTEDDLLVNCHMNCGWFNKEDDECSIVTIAQNVKYLRQTLEEIHQHFEEQDR